MAQLKIKTLLFGRTGSGKSTIANMLIRGSLDPPLLFGTSSGIRGKTLDMQREESESRIVVDTVGFGETEGGSVSDEEAKNRLYNFFVKLSEGYHYFAYVHKWGKTDYLDTNLWSFFKQAFEGAEDNFVVFFTHSKPEYIEQHREELRSVFVGCERYVSVDFPTDRPQKVSDVKLKINNRLRIESLKRLESSLIHFMRPSVIPWVVPNMRKGVLVLIGECTSSKDMIMKLLVDGVLEPPNMRSTELEGPPQVDPLCNTSLEGGGLGDAASVATSFTDVEGRGWRVRNLQPVIGKIFGVSLWNQSYLHYNNIRGKSFFTDHAVFVTEDTCQLSANDLKEITEWSTFFEQKVGVLIINARASRQQEMGQANSGLKIFEAFKHCAFTLYLHFPAFNTFEEVESQNIQTRKESLKILEENLCATVENQNSRDEIRSFQGEVLAYLSAEWRRMQWSPRSQTAICTNKWDWRTNADTELLTTQYVRANVPVAYLQLKCRLAAPRKLHVYIQYCEKHKRTLELQLVDIHGKEKEVPKLRFHDVALEDFVYWTIELSKGAFLDCIEQGDSIVLWVIPNDNAIIELKSGQIWLLP